MSTKSTEQTGAQHTPTLKFHPTDVEATLEFLRDQGIDPHAIEKTLPNCICGMPQVIIGADFPNPKGIIRFWIKCTQRSRQICRVSKRIRIHRVTTKIPAFLLESELQEIEKMEDQAELEGKDPTTV